MDKKLALAILGILFSLSFPTPSWAETVLEKVARTGVLTAGTRTDAVPFAYINDEEEWRGYSIDMLVLIKEQLEEELNKDITLELVKVTPQDRIPKVLSGEVDIVCGSTSFTWNRDKFVDFSLSYAVTGTQLLVKQDSNLGSADSLKGKRIGIISGTINESVIELVQPQATLVTFKNGMEGMSALQQGKIDAFAWDGILLKGLQQKASNPATLAVVPEEPYAKEGIACMVPEENSQFLDTVNYSLARFMQGFLVGEEKSVDILNQWFGTEGIVPVNRSVVVEFFQDVIDTREQIPISQSE